MRTASLALKFLLELAEGAAVAALVLAVLVVASTVLLSRFDQWET